MLLATEEMSTMLSANSHQPFSSPSTSHTVTTDFTDVESVPTPDDVLPSVPADVSPTRAKAKGKGRALP